MVLEKKKKKEKQFKGDEQKTKEKENINVTSFILKADLHCEGCVSKVLKCIRSFSGVQKASIGDGQQITVVGKVDPARLCERLEKKMHKRIEIISPFKGTKEKDGGNGKTNKVSDKKSEAKKHTKEDKMVPVTTAAMKVHLHCHGCTQKIYKLVTQTKGYKDMKIDKQKEMVTVTGAIDMNVLANSLKKHLKREVQIFPEIEKKDNKIEKKDNKGGEKANVDKGKTGGDKEKNNGGKTKSNPTSTGGEKLEGKTSEPPVEHALPVTHNSGIVVEQFHYNPCEYGSHHAPQIFSDENPNACSVM